MNKKSNINVMRSDNIVKDSEICALVVPIGVGGGGGNIIILPPPL